MATSSTEKSQAAVGSGAARSARGPARSYGSGSGSSSSPGTAAPPMALPLRLASVRFGSARLGSARLSSARLGPARCARSQPAARSHGGQRAWEAQVPKPAPVPRQTLPLCLELRSLPLHIGVSICSSVVNHLTKNESSG